MKKVYLVKEFISDIDESENADYEIPLIGDTLHVCESKELAESLVYKLNKKYAIGIIWATNKEYLKVKDCNNCCCYYDYEEKEIITKELEHV